MSTRGHNDPIQPPDEFLQYMRENYVLVGDDLIYSLRAEKFIGTKSNGCPVHDGYKRVKVNIAAGEKFFKYHHVTFFLFYGRWPRLQVDHKNGRKADARPENLEEVTDAENQRRLQQKLRHRRASYYENKKIDKYFEWPKEQEQKQNG